MDNFEHVPIIWAHISIRSLSTYKREQIEKWIFATRFEKSYVPISVASYLDRTSIFSLDVQT